MTQQGQSSNKVINQLASERNQLAAERDSLSAEKKQISRLI